MRKKLFTIDHFYIMLSLIFVVLIISSIRSSITIDIHLHDTKFVIAKFHIWMLVLVYTLFVGFSNRYISLSNAKVGIFQWIVLFSFLILILTTGLKNFEPGPNRYLDMGDWISFKDFDSITKIFTIALIAFVVVHLCYWIYFVINLIRRLTSGKAHNT